RAMRTSSWLSLPRFACREIVAIARDRHHGAATPESSGPPAYGSRARREHGTNVGTGPERAALATPTVGDRSAGQPGLVGGVGLAPERVAAGVVDVEQRDAEDVGERGEPVVAVLEDLLRPARLHPSQHEPDPRVDARRVPPVREQE